MENGAQLKSDTGKTGDLEKCTCALFCVGMKLRPSERRKEMSGRKTLKEYLDRTDRK